MHPEYTLLVRARRFDECALADIYDLYSPGIYRYAWRLLGDVELAEECVADTFNRLLEALKHRSGPSYQLKAYMYRIAHNWISDYYRRRPPEMVSVEEIDLSDPNSGSEYVALQAIRRQEVWNALGELTPDQRQVIVLKYLEGWSNAEIAQSLDKPISAVKALRHRGIRALRRRLVHELDVQDG